MNKWLTNKLIAHRGCYDNIKIPENTLKSFQRAVNNDYAIELDVQLTKDKELIVYHDADLLRLCEANYQIKDLYFAELRQYKLLRSAETIPKLKDVLRLINNQVPLFIEIKQNGLIGDLENKLIEELQQYKGRYVILSFNALSLKYIKTKLSCAIIGQNYDPTDYKINNNILSIIYLLRNILTSKPDLIVFNAQTLHRTIINIFNKYFTMIAYNLKKTEPDIIADNIIFDP